MALTAMESLEGRMALVTGASRRIGRETALGLARHGADVAITALSAREEIEAVADEIRSLGRRAVVTMGNVADEKDVARMVGEVVDVFGRIDILVNNAAIRKHRPFVEISLDEWHEVLGVALDGAFLMCRQVIPVMLRNDGGTIVNIGGVTAHIGAKERAHVSAAKAGLVGLTKALAVEYADRGITVNCVVPGKIGGPRSATSGASGVAGETLVGREGMLEEAGGMVVTMCLPFTKYMTGQTVHVSGGLYMP